MSEWSLWVLDHGLPELPEGVANGESVPVARWVGPEFAAVLHVYFRPGDEGDPDDAASLETETEVSRRTGVRWEDSRGSGGSNWVSSGP